MEDGEQVRKGLRKEESYRQLKTEETKRRINKVVVKRAKGRISCDLLYGMVCSQALVALSSEDRKR